MTIRPSRSNLDFMTAPGNDPDSHGVGWPYPHYRVPSSRSFLPTPSASTSTSACTFTLQTHISHTLPSELWIEIFTNLSSSADISNITLTCTTFCTLAQPLLFATLDVCPFHLGYNRSGPILRSHAYLKRTKERIALYTSSSKIRSNVRTVWISPYPRNASSRTACIGAENGRRDYLEPELVIEEVVNVLEMFPNLTSLSWHAVEMKWEWWNVIRKLNLSSLWINASGFPAIGPPPPLPPASLTPASESEKDGEGDIEQLSLPVQHLHLDHWAYNGSLMNHVSVAEAHSPGVQLDILTLTIVPSVIETLSVPRPSTAHWIVGLLSQYGHQGAAFQQLTSLSLPYSAFTATAAGSDLINTADDLAKALEVCPKLEELQIFEPPSVGRSRQAILPSLPVNTLPALHTFEGPATFASTFVDGRRPLQQLTLWGLDGPGAVCDVEKLETILHDLADLDVDCKLHSLKINVSNATTELLEALRALRGMKLLSVNSGTGEMVSGSMRLSEGFANFGIGAGRGPVFGLYDLLCNTRLPPALESLKISSKLDSRRSDALDGESQQTEALELIACLKMDNPSLENVEIAYGGYWMGNYCVKWNRNATRRPRFNESSRKRFSSIFWEGSMGVAGNKGVIELDVNDIIEGAARRRGESRGVKGLFGWISRLWSCLL